MSFLDWRIAQNENLQDLIDRMHSSFLPKEQLETNEHFSKIRISVTGTEINSDQFKNAKKNFDQIPRNQLLSGSLLLLHSFAFGLFTILLHHSFTSY